MPWAKPFIMTYIRTKLRVAPRCTLAATRGFRSKRYDVHLHDLTDIDFSVIHLSHLCACLTYSSAGYMSQLFTYCLPTIICVMESSEEYHLPNFEKSDVTDVATVTSCVYCHLAIACYLMVPYTLHTHPELSPESLQ